MQIRLCFFISFVFLSVSVAYGAQMDMGHGGRQKDKGELERLEYLRLYTVYNNIILLLDYGVKIINDDGLLERFNIWTCIIRGDLSRLKFGIALDDLQIMVVNLAKKLKLAEKPFFCTVGRITTFQDFYSCVAGYTPFIVSFLDYCVRREQGNFFAKRPDVFDETSSDYIDIEYILELLEKSLSLFDKKKDELGTPVTIDGKKLDISFSACNAAVQMCGKWVITQIKHRHKKVFLQEKKEKVLHRVERFEDSDFDIGNSSDFDDDNSSDFDEDGFVCGSPVFMFEKQAGLQIK